jgi:hypothetical protein
MRGSYRYFRRYGRQVWVQMALHRDIYWVGRQWAVTGLGLQAIDQRLKGAFDIEVARVWDDDVPERMRAHAWLNAADFDKALTAARTRFPEPPRQARPLVDSILDLIHPPPPEPPKPVTARPESRALPSEPIASEPPATPAPAAMPVLRAEGRLARFLPQWRVRP